MRGLLLILSFVAICLNNSTAQVSVFIDWKKSIGGSGNDAGYSAIQTADGGYVVVGDAGSNNGDLIGNHGTTDIFVRKLYWDGSLQWQKLLGGTGAEYGRSIQQTTDGGYIVAGYNNSINNNDVSGGHGGFDYWIVKLDGTGTIQWQKSLGGSGVDIAYCVQQTADGGYIVVGEVSSTNGDVSGSHGGVECWIVKLSDSGNIQWQKAYGGTGDDYGYSIRQCIDGGYIIAGQSTSDNGDVVGNHGFNDMWIFRIDISGNMEWQRSIGGSLYDYGRSAIPTSDTGYIVAGQTSSSDWDVPSNQGFDDCWILKLNVDGSTNWQKTYGGSGYDAAYSIRQTTDNGYIFAGRTNSINGDIGENHGNYDYWVVKIDSAGNRKAEKTFGGSGNDYPFSVEQTQDAGFVVAGVSNSQDGDVTGNHNGSNDAWIFKLSPVVGIEESAISVSNINAYPNPASDAVNISFSLSKSEKVAVAITDVTGREVITLGNKSFSAGMHNLKWNINDAEGNRIQSGVYFLTIKTPAAQTSRKLVVME